jgi:transcriptional regulator with XRE-family HTH domain
MLEALRIGRTLRKPESSKGEKNGRAVLDWEKVRTIRQLYRQGLTQQSIADNFGVKQVTISAIVRGKHWTGGELMDVTEDARREISQGINGNPQGRAGLEAAHGQVWDTEELTQDFLVLAFANPLVVVKRKTDGVKGSLFFQGTPRLYFKFEEAIVSER